MIRDQTDHRTELERLAPGLRRFARALVARDADNPRDEADALTRDTLARAIRAERSGRSRNPRIWLYATLTTLNRARSRGRPTSNAGAAPGHDILGKGVTDALNDLPIDLREAYLLVVLEGFSYAETADALGLPRVVVGARIARARAMLVDSLDAARPIGQRGKSRGTPYLRLVT